MEVVISPLWMHDSAEAEELNEMAVSTDAEMRRILAFMFMFEREWSRFVCSCLASNLSSGKLKLNSSLSQGQVQVCQWETWLGAVQRSVCSPWPNVCHRTN